MELPDDVITAELSGPSTVKTNEAVTVTDTSYVPDTLTVTEKGGLRLVPEKTALIWEDNMEEQA